MGDEGNLNTRRRVTEIPSTARVSKYLTRYKLNSLASEQQMLEYDDSYINPNLDNSNYDEQNFNLSSPAPSYAYNSQAAQVPGMSLRSKTLPSRRDGIRRSSPSRNQRYSDYEQSDISNQDNTPHNNTNLHEGLPPQKKRSFFSKIISWFIDLVFYIATSVIIFLDIQILSRLGAPFRGLFAKNHTTNGIARNNKWERSVCGTFAMILFIAFIVAITALLMASSYQKNTTSPPIIDIPPNTINRKDLEKLVEDKLKQLIKAELVPINKEQTNQQSKLEGLNTRLTDIQTTLTDLPTNASVNEFLQFKIGEVRESQENELGKLNDAISKLQKLFSELEKKPTVTPTPITPSDNVQFDTDDIVRKVKDELNAVILEKFSTEKATLQTILLEFIKEEISKHQIAQPITETPSSTDPVGTPHIQEPPKLMDLLFKQETEFLKWLKENYKVENNLEKQEILKWIIDEINKIEKPNSNEIVQQEKELIQKWISEAPQNLNEEEVNKIIEKYIPIFTKDLPNESTIKSWIDDRILSPDQIITSQEQTIKSWFKDVVTGSQLKSLRDWVKNTIKSEISDYDKAHTPTEIKSTDDLIGVVQSLPTRTVVEEMIAHELEIYTADKNGKIDYALASNGGKIIKERTSPNYERPAQSSGWLSSISIRRKGASSFPAHTILHHDIHPGYCWAFTGSKGHVGIALSELIVIRSVSIEHTPNFITRRNQSAPREFNVFGLQSESDIGTLLGKFEYDINKPNHLQTFEIDYTTTPLVPYRMVLLDVTSNHGYIPYTCIYRFRVHGDPVYENGEENESLPSEETPTEATEDVVTPNEAEKLHSKLQTV